MMTDRTIPSENRPLAAQQPIIDSHESFSMLARLSELDVIAIDGALLDDAPLTRMERLLKNRAQIAPERLPWVLIGSFSPDETARARRIASRLQPFCHTLQLVALHQQRELATAALALHKTHFPAPPGGVDARKARLLLLVRRGGKSSQPQFIKPFVGGAGTTCGAWTPIVAYQKGKTTWIAGTRPKADEQGATPIRGFLRGNYAQGVCPVECSFCYLRGLEGTEIKSIALNLEDTLPELERLPPGSIVNWAELGGPVEQDPWFVDPETGEGSLVQTILDLACSHYVASFFLTKGVYEPYLQLQGRLAHVGISLNAPEISAVFEPGGAPAEARLKGLRWAIEHGALDHTIRLGPIIPYHNYQASYRRLFEMIRDVLGSQLRRITVDLLRFSPQMPAVLRASFPPEIVEPLLREMAPEVKAHKYRPSRERQAELYHWVRSELNRYGLPQVALTPCKADPAEAMGFLRAGDLGSMPCACHLSYQMVAQIHRREVPVFQPATARAHHQLPLFAQE